MERIESVAVGAIEGAEGGLRLQYRGETIGVEDPEGVLADDGELMATVLICESGDGQRRVGLVVREVYEVARGTVLPEDEGMALVEGRPMRVRGMRGVSLGLDRYHREVA